MISATYQQATKSDRAAAWSLAGILDDYCLEVLDRLGWPEQKGKRILRTIGITSCRSGEGVTTLAAHLATAAAARQEGRVVLVNANLTRPAAARIFGTPASPGLIDCVCNREPVLETLHPTIMENLSVLAAGVLQGSPARVYDSANLLDIVADLAGHAALAIFDLPPVRQVSCASRLTPALDGTILVVEAQTVPREAVRRAQEILRRAGARIVGAVLNKWREHGVSVGRTASLPWGIGKESGPED